MPFASENNVQPQDNGGLIYIASKGHSGTTLLSLVLTMADDHIYAGELKSIWDAGLRRNYL